MLLFMYKKEFKHITQFEALAHLSSVFIQKSFPKPPAPTIDVNFKQQLLNREIINGESLYAYSTSEYSRLFLPNRTIDFYFQAIKLLSLSSSITVSVDLSTKDQNRIYKSIIQKDEFGKLGFLGFLSQDSKISSVSNNPNSFERPNLIIVSTIPFYQKFDDLLDSLLHLSRLSAKIPQGQVNEYAQK